MRARRIALFAALAGTAACSAIAGLDGDFVNGGATSTPDNVDAAKADAAQTQQKDGQVGTDDAPITLSDAGQDGTTSGDSDADAAPLDACASWVPDGVNVNVLTTGPINCKTTSYLAFCWDFKGGDPSPAYGWNDASVSSGASLVTEGANGDAGTVARAHVSTTTAAGGSANLLWFQWPDPGKPLDFPISRIYDVAFTFQLDSADRAATIVSLAFGGQTVGAAVYPDPCNGKSRVALAGHDPTTYAAGAYIELHQRYRAHLIISRPAADQWTAELKIGNVSVDNSDLAVTAGVGTTVATDLKVGLSAIGASGSSDVVIDDIWF